jgi:thymidine kinase
MNTGKSTQLLQIAFNYEEGGHRVLLFTAAVDGRTKVGQVTSRLGASRPAQVFDASLDFYALLAQETGLSCVLIDEAQFLTAAQAKQLHRFAAVLGIPVMCFGLRSDFRGEPFEGSAYLLTLAEDLQEIKAICACGRKSTMNMRINDDGTMVKDGPQLLIGGNSVYRQVCARCFYRLADGR